MNHIYANQYPADVTNISDQLIDISRLKVWAVTGIEMRTSKDSEKQAVLFHLENGKIKLSPCLPITLLVGKSAVELVAALRKLADTLEGEL